MALEKGFLQQELYTCFINTIPAAFAQAFKEALPNTKMAEETAEKFGNTLSELLSENWSKYISDAIDVYIKNANIHGMLITNGSPTTHICNINSPMPPLEKGVTPNSLKIE